MSNLTDFRRETLDSIKVKAVDAEGNVFILNVRELVSRPQPRGGYDIEIIVDLPTAAKRE